MVMIIQPSRFASASSGHRYWRVNCLTRAGGSVYVIGEIEFIGTAGGPDITPTLTGPDSRVIFSSQYSGIGLLAWKAYDNNVDICWASDSGGPATAWIGWDFGANQSLYSVKIKSGTTSSFQQPATGNIEYSDDGSSWTVAATFSHSWGDNQTVEVVL